MKRVIILAVTVSVLVMAMAGVALAATPQDIYNDYADNGKLDKTYTTQELQAYLNDATVHQYGDEVVLGELDTLVKSMLTGGGESRSDFPFTGAEMALIIGGAVVLIGAGTFLRRASRKSS